MNLIVDIGNTVVKTAVMDGQGKVLSTKLIQAPTSREFALILEANPQIQQAIISSTRGDEQQLAAILRPLLHRVLVFTPQTPVPIVNEYFTPATLGCDRLAAAVGAATLYPGRNVLIVDFGTAITLDLLVAGARFRGGCISPGMQMRFQALHERTAALPLCSPEPDPQLLGQTTSAAIVLGVMNGIIFEVEGYISRLQDEFDDLCIIFTGGDAKYFVKRIKNTIFANCNLVSYGLNRILEYNDSEENPD